MAKKYVYNKFRLMYNGEPLSINTTEYVRGETLVERSTHICTTYEEAQILKFALALQRNINPKEIVIERYSSDITEEVNKPFTANLNKHFGKQKTFSGKGLKYNTVELPSKYKKGTYQGKSDNNPLNVKPEVNTQVLTSLKTGVKQLRKVDNSGIKDYLRRMKSDEPSHSVYFAESVERNKGTSINKNKEKHLKYDAIEYTNKYVHNRRNENTLSMHDVLLDNLRKMGLGKKKLRVYLRSKGWKCNQAKAIIKQL